MDRFLFVLGRTPELSVQEISSFGVKGELIGNFLYSVSFPVKEKAEAKVREIFKQLGGSLKLLKVVGEFGEASDDQLLDYVGAYFAQFERPTFAIGEIGRDSLPKIQLSDIKAKLRDRGVASRFIEGTREGLSAAVLSHKSVEELIIIRQPDTSILFGQTLDVQDIDDWTKRDRSKPYADRKKGMLPPKLARMMVNLGRGAATELKIEKPVIYDPFCGSGTVIMEAASLGFDTIGSDLDQTAVQGSTENMDWLVAEEDLSTKYAVFYGDATRVTVEQLDQPATVIVTEPFLGKQTPALPQLANIFKGLEKLYIGAFRQWRHILADTAAIVIVFPVAQAGKQRFSLESIIDKLAVLGYTPTSEPCLYHRPNAVIERQIWTFQFKKPVGEASNRH